MLAGAVIDSADREHLASGWEFPGAELEPGERRASGLAREFQQELGIAIRNPRPLIRVRLTYPYGEVLVDMWVVSRYGGEPRGLDGQALQWLSQEELEEASGGRSDRTGVAVTGAAGCTWRF